MAKRKKQSQPEGTQQQWHSFTGHPRAGTQTSDAKPGGSNSRKPSNKMRNRLAQRKFKLRTQNRLPRPAAKVSSLYVHIGTDVEVVYDGEPLFVEQEQGQEDEVFFLEEEEVEEEDFFFFLEEETA